MRFRRTAASPWDAVFAVRICALRCNAPAQLTPHVAAARGGVHVNACEPLAACAPPHVESSSRRQGRTRIQCHCAPLVCHAWGHDVRLDNWNLCLTMPGTPEPKQRMPYNRVRCLASPGMSHFVPAARRPHTSWRIASCITSFGRCGDFTSQPT